MVIEPEQITPPQAFSDAEFNLLTLCARVVLSSAEHKAIREHVQNGVDWDRFWVTARHHRVVPLVAHSLRDAGAEVLPERVRSRADEIVRDSYAKNELFVGVLRGVLEIFQERGIRTLPIKGPLLGNRLYGDLGHRTSGDVDLLIAPADRNEVERSLIAEGYASTERGGSPVTRPMRRYLRGHAVYRQTRVKIKVDVHTRIVPPFLAYDPDFEKLWSRSITTTIAGFRCREMETVDCLLMLCNMGLKKQWYCLRPLCDVAECVRANQDLDWDAVLARAYRLRAGRAVCLGLYLAHEVLGSDLPAPVAAATVQMPDLREVAARLIKHLPPVRHSNGAGISERIHFHLDTKDTVGAKIRCVALRAAESVLRDE